MDTIDKYFYFIEFLLLSAYKAIFEFIYLDAYFESYGYLHPEGSYEFVFDKFIISVIIFAFFCTLLLKYTHFEESIFIYLCRFIFILCVIPMLSIYAFFSACAYWDFVVPTIFFAVFVTCLKFTFSNNSKEIEYRQCFTMPKIKNIDIYMIIGCGIIAVAIWLFAGHPIINNFSEAFSRRMELRMNALPSLIYYIFIFLGSSIFPYLFAKYFEKKKYALAILSLVFGLLLFMVNGMKTWLFLYFLFLGIKILVNFAKKDAYKFVLLFEMMMLFIITFALIAYSKFAIIDFTGQISRVLVVPSVIGYRNVDFFRSNELVLLRESILRHFFQSPYAYGSDYYVFHGNNTTITSSRANNGLWGDAFKNFGVVGIISYPFLYTFVFKVINDNSYKLSSNLKIFIVFLVMWGAINTSFFTWLVTGGVIVIILLTKIDATNEQLEN